GDLDECNGRFGVTPEFPEGIYHYYVTEEFPFVGRMWRGTPDPSFSKGPGGPRRGPGAIGPRGLLEGGEPPLGGGGRPPMPPVFNALDANNDGAIDAKEIENAAAALRKFDKNGDGRLTPDEFRPANRPPPERRDP